MSDDQINVKFRALAARTLPAARVEGMLDKLWRLGDGDVSLDEIFAEAVVE